jgi:hypothetical protein
MICCLCTYIGDDKLSALHGRTLLLSELSAVAHAVATNTTMGSAAQLLQQQPAVHAHRTATQALTRTANCTQSFYHHIRYV